MIASVILFWEKGGPGYQAQVWPLLGVVLALGAAVVWVRPRFPEKLRC